MNPLKIKLFLVVLAAVVALMPMAGTAAAAPAAPDAPMVAAVAPAQYALFAPTYTDPAPLMALGPGYSYQLAPLRQDVTGTLNLPYDRLWAGLNDGIQLGGPFILYIGGIGFAFTLLVGLVALLRSVKFRG